MTSDVLTPSAPLSSDGAVFVDRRDPTTPAATGRERRQFSNSYDELTPEAAELARAIDAYKLRNRRRFISYEEMLQVVKELGYSR